jgi:hypothetical protein
MCFEMQKCAAVFRNNKGRWKRDDLKKNGSAKENLAVPSLFGDGRALVALILATFLPA